MDRPAYKLADRSAKLLQAILQDDLDAFQAALSVASLDEINKFHGFPHDWTCLQCAIQRGRMEFIEPLLHAGAEVNDFNPVRKVSPIHLAVKNTVPESLEILLRYGANVNGREGEGRTALHILIGQWNRDGMENARWPYFELLVSHLAIDVNAQDNTETTALELAVRKNLVPVARKLLHAGAVVNQHVRSVMQDKMPDLLAEYPEDEAVPNNNEIEMTSDYLEAELWKALRNGHYERFQQLLNQVQAGGVGSNVNLSTSSSDHNPTLLQYACETQAASVVAALLAAGVDPNQTSNKSSVPPLVEASLKGNLEILQLLAQHPHIQLDVVDNVQTSQTALHKIAQKLHDANTVEDKSRYSQCLHLLLASSGGSQQHGSINVNAQDAFGNTALHYAALSGVEEAVLQLLRAGAHLGMKNHLDETAVKRILPSTLESFLDSCVRVQDQEVSINNFNVTFDYSILAPPRWPTMPPSRLQPSETGIAFHAQLNNDAVESVSLHTAPEEEKIYPECEALWHLSTSTKHQYLLKHPLITSFLELKWHNIRFFYYVNVLIYSLAVLVLTTFILLLHSGYAEDSMKVPLDILWYCLLIFVTILFAREMFQLGIAPFRYLFSPENYIELIMLACTSVVLAHSDDPSSWRSISAVAVLLAWGEGLLLLGRHPKLSIFVTMFTTVSMTFLRLLLWYSILIIGFGLSFFLVFRPSSAGSNSSSTDSAPSSDDKKDSAFDNVPGSLLKVSAMMAGELEFGDLPFDINPIASRIIFVAFLFLITIVLLNLLNGMAVSDTQAIQSKAETIGYVSRVELISYLESMLLGDPFHFLADWPPFAFIRRHCPFYSPVSRMMRGDVLRGFIHSDSTVLFYRCLPNKTFTVFPYRKMNQISSTTNSDQRTICNCHSTFRLDEHILQSAVQRARETSKQRAQEDANAQLLSEMDKLQTAVRLLQSQNAKLMQLLQRDEP